MRIPLTFYSLHACCLPALSPRPAQECDLLDAELAFESASAAVDVRHAQSLWEDAQGLSDEQQRMQRRALEQQQQQEEETQETFQTLPSITKPVARILAETEQIYYGDVQRLRAACESEHGRSSAQPPHTPPDTPHHKLPARRLPPVGPPSSHMPLVMPMLSGGSYAANGGMSTPDGSPVAMRAGSYGEAVRRSAVHEVREMQRATSDPMPQSRRRTGVAEGGGRTPAMRSSCSLPAISMRRE